MYKYCIENAICRGAFREMKEESSQSSSRRPLLKNLSKCRLNSNLSTFSLSPDHVVDDLLVLIT